MSDPVIAAPHGRSSLRASTTGSFSWRHGAGAGAWIAAVIAIGVLAPTYWTGLGSTVGITALLALGIVLVTGYAGQFSLAVGAFYGIGAYGSAMLTVNYGWPGLLAIVASAAIAAVVALALGRPIFRLRGHFLAMGTLALTEVFYLLVTSLPLTGAAGGIGGIQPLSLFGYSILSTKDAFIVNWLVVGVILWGMLRLRRGREGRALRAIRGNEAAANAAGIDIPSSKTRIFTASAVISSLAGSLYAHQVLYVSPSPFGVGTAIDILVVAVLGGLASPWGAVVGAVVFEALRQGIDTIVPVVLGPSAVGAGQTLFVGLLMVVILIVRPDGIAGVIGSVAARLRPAHRAGTAQEAPDGDGRVETMAEVRRAHDIERVGHVAGEVVLEASGLRKSFGGVTAVDGVSLAIRAGEVLAVIGPNGAGKTTLVNLISGNLRSDAGTVRIDAVDLSRRPAHVRARAGLARTFQTPALFEGMDVASTVKVGAHRRGTIGMLRSAVPTIGAVREERRLDDEVAAVLERLGLGLLAGALAKNLSLGQQKQIEIARALVGRPRVLLLDEPCAGLNKAEKKALMLLLRRLATDGLAVLVIEHDMEFVMACSDRVHVLNFGATLREGDPAEIQADQSVIDAYLGVAPAALSSAEALASDALTTEEVR